MLFWIVISAMGENETDFLREKVGVLGIWSPDHGTFLRSRSRPPPHPHLPCARAANAAFRAHLDPASNQMLISGVMVIIMYLAVFSWQDSTAE